MPDDDTKPEMMPKADFLNRMKSKNGRITELEGQLEAARDGKRTAEQTLKASDSADYQGQLDTLKSERDEALQSLTDFRSQAQTREAMMKAGITDPEDMDLARYRYARLPEEGRPDLTDWLAESAKEDRHLQHLWSDGKPEVKPKPDSNGRVKAPVRPPNSLTLEAIQAMSITDRLDPANREAIAAAIAHGA